MASESQDAVRNSIIIPEFMAERGSDGDFSIYMRYSYSWIWK